MTVVVPDVRPEARPLPASRGGSPSVAPASGAAPRLRDMTLAALVGGTPMVPAMVALHGAGWGLWTALLAPLAGGSVVAWTCMSLLTRRVVRRAAS